MNAWKLYSMKVHKKLGKGSLRTHTKLIKSNLTNNSPSKISKALRGWQNNFYFQMPEATLERNPRKSHNLIFLTAQKLSIKIPFIFKWVSKKTEKKEKLSGKFHQNQRYSWKNEHFYFGTCWKLKSDSFICRDGKLSGNFLFELDGFFGSLFRPW